MELYLIFGCKMDFYGLQMPRFNFIDLLSGNLEGEIFRTFPHKLHVASPSGCIKRFNPGRKTFASYLQTMRCENSQTLVRAVQV